MIQKKPKTGDDPCSLHGKRREFQQLVDCIDHYTEDCPSDIVEEWPGAYSLYKALFEHGIVIKK